MLDETKTEDRFYDGRTAKTHTVTVKILAGVLTVTDIADERPLAHWRIADMTVVDANAINGEMNFRQRSAEGARLVLGAHAERAELLALAPHLKHWRRHERRRLGKAVTSLTLAALAIAAGCYFGLPRLAIALVEVMPLSWDKKLGDPVRDAVTGTLTSCAGEAGQHAIEALGKRLMPAEIAALPLTIDVVQLKQINAFALPGNHIVVFSGLIDRADSPEMLAGVLAHEMGHLEMRHPSRGLIEQLGLGVAVGLLVGNRPIGNLGQFMASLSYTRDMERQADERAIVLLQHAQIRADGLARFFDVLKKEEKLHVPALLSDHPGLEERAAATRQDSQGGPAMPMADWLAIKAMCGKS